jgi:hypothetical protein
MTVSEQYFWRVAIEQLRVEVAQLHVQAILQDRIGFVSRCEEIGLQLEEYQDEIECCVIFSANELQGVKERVAK